MNRMILFSAVAMMGCAGAYAQLSGSVNVEGEYEPLVIETERLNSFPKGFRFDSPASSLYFEEAGIVTDFRPDILTMGVTGRLTDRPFRKRRGYADLRLGSYLNSAADAGYYVVADKSHTLLADIKWSSTAFRNSISEPKDIKRLFRGHAGLMYDAAPSEAHGLHAGIGADWNAYCHDGPREWLLKADAGYEFTFSDVNTLGLDADGDFVFPHDIFHNYGLVSLKPAYTFANGRLTVRAGAVFSVSYDAPGKEPGEGFPTFHAAPDVRLSCRLNSRVGVFLKATGGVFRASSLLNTSDFGYAMPWLFASQPVYSPLNAKGGVELGPFYGLKVSAAFRYALSRNVPLYAWAAALAPSDARAADLHGFSADLNVSYAYGTVAEVGFEGSYSPQKGLRGIFNGYDRPRWLMEAKAAVRPVKRLSLEVSYSYRGVRACYSVSESGEATGLRLPDITCLNARVGYGILDNLEIYCRGENLLNRRNEILPGLNAAGIAVSGGIYVEF